MTLISDTLAQHNAQRDWDIETDAIENASDESGANWQAAPAGTPDNGALDIDGQRHELIAVAAYFLAERRQFRDGSPEDDWLQAEAEIDRQLSREYVADVTPRG